MGSLSKADSLIQDETPTQAGAVPIVIFWRGSSWSYLYRIIL